MNEKFERFEIKHDNENGYIIISNTTQTEYDLLEGKSFNGTLTSDILFIMSSDDSGYRKLIGWFFGASDGDCLDYCCEIIENYENGIPMNLYQDLND